LITIFIGRGCLPSLRGGFGVTKVVALLHLGMQARTIHTPYHHQLRLRRLGNSTTLRRALFRSHWGLSNVPGPSNGELQISIKWPFLSLSLKAINPVTTGQNHRGSGNILYGIVKHYISIIDRAGSGCVEALRFTPVYFVTQFAS
jgi:hypothetical protein